MIFLNKMVHSCSLGEDTNKIDYKLDIELEFFSSHSVEVEKFAKMIYNLKEIFDDYKKSSDKLDIKNCFADLSKE